MLFLFEQYSLEKAWPAFKNGHERAAENFIDDIFSQRNLDDLFLFYVLNCVPRYWFVVTHSNENWNYVFILITPNAEDIT